MINVIKLKPPNKTREKSLKRAGRSITQNYEWMIQILNSDQFHPRLRDFLRFITSSGALTDETSITVELRKPSDMAPNSIPEAQTCFSTIFLPDEPFDSCEALMGRLLLCCDAATGFGAK